jgi:hypothetical protein
VYPTPKVLNYNFWLNTTDYFDEKSIFPVAAYLSSQLPRLNRLGGFQGYYYVRSNAISADFQAPNEFANATQMTALLEPVLEHMKNMPGMNPSSLFTIPPIDFAALISSGLQSLGIGKPTSQSGTMAGKTMMRRHEPVGEEIVGAILDEDSLLLGEEELNHPKLAEALQKSKRHGDTGVLRGHLVGGGQVMALGNGTSVTPKWRQSYVHMMTTGNDKVYAGALRDISPNGGAYINEVCCWRETSILS